MSEATLNAAWGFRGKLLNVEVLDVALESGGTSTREVIRHPGAAVVLARRADGRFVFVRQYRKAVEADLIEVVAGTLDPGEAPEDCARRELSEESGYRAVSLHRLGAALPAPGYTDERLHLFYADVEPDPEPQAPDPDEVVEVVLLSEAAVEARIRAGDIEDAKTMACWLMYKNRAEERQGAMAN